MAFIVITAVAPLRSEPSHKSEMVSQLLFGELLEPLENSGDFVKVKLKYDGYTGWCQRKQLTEIEGSKYPFATRLSRSMGDSVTTNDRQIILSPGSTTFIPDSNEPIQTGRYALRFNLKEPEGIQFQSISESVIYYARLFIGTPYIWGGRSRYGIDCSGLTQTVFMLCGIFLPRDSGPQSREGDVVNFLQEAKPGDLAFFDDEEGRIVHVGILLNDQSIIHASASVRIDPIDNFGIVHAEEGDRTHKLRVIKRFF